MFRHSAAGGTTSLGSWGGSACSTGNNTIRLLWNAGVLTLWVNGLLIAQVFHSEWASNIRAGLVSFGTATGIDEFTLLGDETTTFTVTPAVVGNFGNSTAMSFAGVGTSWTPGTPGSPSFTVDHGTLTDQEITSATAATATYTPGNFLGTATFTDPSTGAQDTVNVSSDPNVIPPVITTLFNEAFIALANRTGDADTGGLLTATDTDLGGDFTGLAIKGAVGELILGRRQLTGTGTSSYDPALLHTLWRLANGGYAPSVGPFPEPGYETTDAGLVDLRTQLDEITSNGADSLDSIMNLLGGDPFASHATILSEIRGLPAPDNQEVLDAIAAAQGDPLATIKAVLDRVYLLDPPGTNSLQAILDAIAAIDTGAVDLQPVLDAIDDLRTYLHGEHETIRTELAAGFLVVSAIQALLGSATGTVANVISGVTDVLAVANDIRDTMAAATVPPVWIDEAHADVGESVALADAVELTGPLDGVIVTITTAPSGAGKFAFGDLRSWRYVGAVVFQNDRGDWEWAQPIGLTDQIVTPRTMQHASAARFRLESGWQGTARAFTVTAGA
jgi:hypothetical protein